MEIVVISFNSGQVPFAKLQDRLKVTVSPLMRQHLSDKDHHCVSASVMKAEAQVKRRRQALHLDKVVLERSSKWQRRERPTALGGFNCHRTGRAHRRSSTMAGHTVEVQPPTRGREGRAHHRSSNMAGHTVEVQPPTRGREGRTHRRSSTTTITTSKLFLIDFFSKATTY